MDTNTNAEHRNLDFSTVLVWPKKFSFGWPSKERHPLVPALCLPIQVALSRSYDTDAHFVAYAYDAAETCGFHYRLRLDSGVLPQMHLLVVDVDDTVAHSLRLPSSESWWTDQKELLADLPAGAYIYRTKGGYRIVYRIQPRSVEGWADHYLRVLSYLMTLGIMADPQCKDWTRCYRLPHASRDVSVQATTGKAALLPEALEVIGTEPGFWPVPDSDLPPVAEDFKRMVPEPSSTPSSPVSIPENTVDRARAYLARIPGAKSGNGGHNQTFSAACALVKGFCLTEEQALSLLMVDYNPRCSPPWSERELVHKVQEASKAAGEVGYLLKDKPLEGAEGMALDDGMADATLESAIQEAGSPVPQVPDKKWKKLLRKSPQGKYVSSASNVSLIMAHDPQWKGVLSYDLFAEATVLRAAPPWDADYAPVSGFTMGQDVTEADGTRLESWLSRHYGISISDSKAHAVIDMAAQANAFHPVRQYLQGLKWDGTKRLGSWMVTYLGAADTPYTRRVGEMLLLSMVARVMVPGCLVRTVVILEGGQEAGKSTVCSILGGDWYSDSLSEIGSKDSYQDLRGVWLLELGELAGLSKSEVTATKHFISKKVDTYRPSFGHRTVKVPRQSVLIGTTNATQYLRDETGNTRFLPVSVGKIDLKALREDRDLLMAEAFQSYKDGAKWWVENDEAILPAFRTEQEQRREQHPWEDEIRTWVQGRASVSVAEVLSDCLDIKTGSHKGADGKIVSSILQHLLKWTRRQDSSGRNRYYAPETPAETPVLATEVEATRRSLEAAGYKVEVAVSVGGACEFRITPATQGLTLDELTLV